MESRIWNKALVFFLLPYFLDVDTRYKHFDNLFTYSYRRDLPCHAHRKVFLLFSKVAYFMA